MKKQTQVGQAFVEIALLMGVFMFLSVGVIEFSRACLMWQAVSAAAHEGARRGAVLGSEAGLTPSETAAAVDAYVRTKYYAALNPAELTVETVWPDGANDPGMTIRVTARHSFKPVVSIDTLPSEFTSTSEVLIIH